jgi:hypothetical protein
MTMHAPGTDGMSDDVLELRLRETLYRIDCPDAHRLGEYELDLLEASERTRVAAHALDCEECTSELTTLRAFLATPTSVPAEPVLGRARRIVATLFTPRPGLAYGGLRGGGSDAATRVYEAGGVTITLEADARSRSMLGLVVAGDTPLEPREVRLLPPDGVALGTQLDDLGNFEFAPVAAGNYVLEIDLPEGVVVVEDLRVD